MIVVSHNLASLPFLFLASVMDLFLMAIAARLVLGRLDTDWAGRAVAALAPVTDALPKLAWRRFGNRMHATWLAWFIVILVGMFIRYAMLAIAMAIG